MDNGVPLPPIRHQWKGDDSWNFSYENRGVGSGTWAACSCWQRFWPPAACKNTVCSRVGPAPSKTPIPPACAAMESRHPGPARHSFRRGTILRISASPVTATPRTITRSISLPLPPSPRRFPCTGKRSSASPVMKSMAVPVMRGRRNCCAAAPMSIAAPSASNAISMNSTRISIPT